MSFKKWIENPYATLEKISLSNGMTVWAVVLPVKWMHWKFVLNSGSCFNPSSLNSGYSHFLEHFIARKFAPLNYQLERNYMKRTNAWTNLSNNWYGTSVFSKFNPFILGASKIKNSMDVLMFQADVLFGQQTWSGHDLSAERRIILDEFGRKFPLGDKQFDSRLRYQILGNEDIEFLSFVTNLGNTKSINEITLSDLLSFKNEYYFPGNTNFLFLGPGVFLEKALRLLELLPNSKERKIIHPTQFLPKYSATWEDYSLGLVQTENCEVTSALYLFPELKNAYAFPILEKVIYRHLYDELRNTKSLVYGVKVEGVFNPCYHEIKIVVSCNKKHAQEVSIVISEYLESAFSEDAFFEAKKEVVHMLKTPSVIPSDVGIIDKMLAGLLMYGQVFGDRWAGEVANVDFDFTANIFDSFSRPSARRVILSS